MGRSKVRAQPLPGPSMTFLQVFVLAVVQGITEFLPISSSAHLVLLHEFSRSTPEAALALDVAVHLGTMVAVVIFFWAEVRRALAGLGQLATGKAASPDARLALALIVATIPAVVLGGVLAVTGWIDALRTAAVIGWTMIVFGLLLYLVHRMAPETRTFRDWNLRDAVVMGLWQALALIPGVSRAGISVTAARYMGFERHDAARIAMLMSIPVILATGGYLGLKLLRAEFSAELIAQLAFGAALAFVTAYVALGLMMRFLNAVSFTPYVIYRVVLGVVLLAIAYG